MRRNSERKSERRNQVAGLDWIRRTERPPSPNGHTPSLSLVDLFCGCGGLTLGVWEACRRSNRQLEVRLAIDQAQEPLAVYRSNFLAERGVVRRDDVARVFNGEKGASPTPVERYWLGRVKTLDLVVAGPPCQGHSDLNNSTRRKDPRNGLYLRVVRAAEIVKPKCIIIENVPTVLHDENAVVNSAGTWLRKLGYKVSEGIVDFGRFLIPQRRKRHILVAVKEGQFTLDGLKDVDNSVPTAGDYLAGLEDEPSQRAGSFYRPSQMTAVNRQRVDYLFDHGLHNLPDKMRPSCHRDKEHAYISMYGRMHWDLPAQTLTSGFGSMGQGRYVHPTQRRLLTPHEAARLQGFPDFFDFSAATTMTSLREMIANAVPPQFTAILVTRLIAEGFL